MDETETLTNSIEKTGAAAAETPAQKKRRERTQQLMQDPPSREQLEQELVRVRTDRKRGRVLRSIVMTIITVAAAAALVSTLNNKILVKRVIAGPGDWVDINEAGDVIVNGRALSEPYLTSKSKGQTTDITYPYQVPDGKYFLMGDHRETSIDSRNSQIGCIGQDRMVGRILLRVWPLSHFGLVR